MSRWRSQLDEFGPQGRRSAKDKRLLGLALTVVVAILVIAGGYAVSAITHLGVAWSPLLWATGTVVIFFLGFLVVRLSR